MRRLLVLVSAIIFVDAMLFGALTPLIPGYAEEFELSKSGAGLLAGAFGAGALFGGLPSGVAAMRFGPKWTVVLGLALLAAASFGFALADGPWALGLARFAQGASSTTTWAGALAWLTVASPRERRGEIIGTAFGIAVLGAILGPMLGAVAELVSVRVSFAAVGGVAIGLAAWAAANEPARAEQHATGALRQALADRQFLAGLWLNLLPAFLFGVLVLLAPLALDEGGFTPLAIGAVFLAAGLIEVAFNPFLGRVSDRVGRLLPVRIALAASVLVSLALSAAGTAVLVAVLVVAASLAFGGFYTPGMALVSDRAETAGLAQGLAFGIMNAAWAAGNLCGPALGGWLADAAGDAATYLVGSALCLATLVAAERIARQSGRSAIARSAG